MSSSDTNSGPFKEIFSFGKIYSYTRKSAHLSIFNNYRSRDSDRIRAGRPRGRGSNPGRGEIFLFSTSSRPVLRSIQPPIAWAQKAISSGINGRGVKPTAHLHLVSRLKIVKLYLHGIALNYYAQGQLYLLQF
jgi:hypothetical protein